MFKKKCFRKCLVLSCYTVYCNRGAKKKKQKLLHLLHSDSKQIVLLTVMAATQLAQLAVQLAVQIETSEHWEVLMFIPLSQKLWPRTDRDYRVSMPINYSRCTTQHNVKLLFLHILVIM